MRRPCPDLIRSLFVALALSLAAPVVVVPALAQDRVDLSPRDLAVVRINIIDLLANEPRLPLPIKQRRDVLRTYYGSRAVTCSGSTAPAPLSWFRG